jgi:hypothetical protein
MLAAAVLAAWTTYLNWLPCQGNMPDECWRRMDAGISFTGVGFPYPSWEPEQHLHGPFDHYEAPTSFFTPDLPRGLFLGDYIGLETTSGDDVIAFFASTIKDGADVHSIALTHPASTP